MIGKLVVIVLIIVGLAVVISKTGIFNDFVVKTSVAEKYCGSSKYYDECIKKGCAASFVASGSSKNTPWCVPIK